MVYKEVKEMNDTFVTWLLIAVIAIFVIAIIYQIIRLWRMKHNEPDHMEMYFESNFKSIIDEWGLITRPKMKTWKNDITTKLKGLSKDISYIETERTSIDKRINKLEKELNQLESA
jgi:hypothetical protein